MRVPRRTGAILCGVVTALLASPGTYAAPVFQPSTRVVLFTPSASDPLAARLEAELTAIGIQVRKVRMPAEGQLEAAVAREIATGARAAIRVIPRPRGAEVWTGETAARMVRRQVTGSGTSDLSVIALQTVEFLRATLLETEEPRARPPAISDPPASPTPLESREATSAPAPPTAEANAAPSGEPPHAAAAGPPPARPAEPAALEKGPEAVGKRERLPEWGLKAPAELSVRDPLVLEISAGPAMIASPGGISPIVSVAVTGRAHVSQQAGIEVMSVFPLARSRLSPPEGSVSIKVALFGAAVVFRLPAPRRLRADVAFGASAVMVRAAGVGAGGVGTGPAPNVGSVEIAWKAAGHARAGMGVDLNRWLSVRADLLGGLTGRTAVGYDVTDVEGQTVTTDRASWGPAFAVATAGLQASW